MAALQLDTALDYAFRGDWSTGVRVDFSINTKVSSHYLEIPLNDNIFEVPVVAIETFRDMALKGHDNIDALSIILYNDGRKAVYVTPDRNMREILASNWQHNHLVCIKVSQNDNTIIYYGGNGMLLTKDLDVIMMLSWQLKRTLYIDKDNNLTIKYKVLRPILRIDPDCYNNSDPMLKWCTNKLFKTGLAEKVFFSCSQETTRIFRPNSNVIMSPSIVIEKSPFNIKTPDMPDVLTTREEILQPAIDHIEDLVV